MYPDTKSYPTVGHDILGVACEPHFSIRVKHNSMIWYHFVCGPQQGCATNGLDLILQLGNLSGRLR